MFFFNFADLDAQNSIVMYNSAKFSGIKIALTEDDDNLRNHGFDNKLTSFEIHGNYYLVQGILPRICLNMPCHQSVSFHLEKAKVSWTFISMCTHFYQYFGNAYLCLKLATN